MKNEYDDVRPENDTELEIYMKAFRESKGTKMTGRTGDAQKAVLSYRKGLKKAVDDGVKSGTLKTRINERQQRLDKAIEGT